jgi:anti-anti-sigma factor
MTGRRAAFKSAKIDVRTPKTLGRRSLGARQAMNAKPEFKTFQLKQLGPVMLVQPVEAEIVSRNLINDLSDDLLELVKSRQPKHLVLSLKRVTRYSSEAIGGLIRVVRRVKAYGGQMKLCMNEDFRDLFKVTHLDGTLFDIYDTESEAVAAFFEAGDLL